MITIPAKTIVTPVEDGDSWFGVSYNMNLYRGCTHGCIYCDSRSECYHISNFDEIAIKENALSILEEELASKKKTGIIGLGSMSDPYNVVEKDLDLTSEALKIINRYGFGVNIVTKSDLVLRDIDILKKIKVHSPVTVSLSITSADDELSQMIERNAITSSKRFEAVRILGSNQIYSGILMMPILPFINDDVENIIAMVDLAKLNNAKFIYPYFGVTVRTGQREYLYSSFDKYFPGMKEKYISTFKGEYECMSLNIKKLKEVFKLECEANKIIYTMNEIIGSSENYVEQKQLSFFESF